MNWWQPEQTTWQNEREELCLIEREIPPAAPHPRRGVVAVVIRGDRFLVIRRSQYVRAPGMHCFPGGSIEPGESEVAAVCREMMEELALAATPVRLLWRSVTPWNVELAWWLTAIDENAEPIANPLEVESYAWLTAAEIRCLEQLLASNTEFLDAWESQRFELPGP